MTAEKSDDVYLWDMLNAARNVESMCAGRSLADYLQDLILRSAVERQIEIIGEAARHVSKSFQDEHAEIAWRPIMAQRHILAHDYGEIDDRRIWNVATQHVPELVSLLVPLLPPEPEDQNDAPDQPTEKDS